MKLYLLGGENLIKKDAKGVNTDAFANAGGSPNVSVFPWARASFDKAYKRRKRLSSYFLSLGANTVEFIDYSTDKAEIARKIGHSDLIYFTGGVASVLVERLRKKGVDRLLRKFEGVVVGRSAGALALCKNFIITDRNNKEMTLAKGLGFVDFSVKVHYVSFRDGKLKKLSNKCPIFAIPCGSAIVHYSDYLSFLSEVYLFRNGEKTLLTEPFYSLAE